MRLSYRLVRDGDGYLAECVESDALGEGRTAKEAVASLRQSLAERMFRPDAIAPPSDPTESTIELVLARANVTSLESLEESARASDGPGGRPRSHGVPVDSAH